MNYGRKVSGGKYHKLRKRKAFERPSQERHVVLGSTARKSLRVKGGHQKVILLKSDSVNVLIDGKTKSAKIINVEETPQNRFLARQNRLVKSAVIETSLGKARISNRPSQEGVVNAILIKAK